jgi:hypothetical protein
LLKFRKNIKQMPIFSFLPHHQQRHRSCRIQVVSAEEGIDEADNHRLREPHEALKRTVEELIPMSMALKNARIKA